MKAQEKRKSWTNEQWYHHYRNQAYVCKGVSYASAIAPMIALMIAKWNEYFTVVYEASKVKFSIGAICAIVVGVIATIQHFKQTEDENVKHLLPILYWGLAFAIIVIFKEVFNDLALIMGVEWAGMTGSSVCNLIQKDRKKWADEYKKGLVMSKTMNNSNGSEDNSIPVD